MPQDPADLLRVFTHELVGHRAGMAYSQESLRYVRPDNLSFRLPEALNGDPRALQEFKDVIRPLEGVQTELASIGLGTSIMATGTLRAWRQIIELRVDIR